MAGTRTTAPTSSTSTSITLKLQHNLNQHPLCKELYIQNQVSLFYFLFIFSTPIKMRLFLSSHGMFIYCILFCFRGKYIQLEAFEIEKITYGENVRRFMKWSLRVNLRGYTKNWMKKLAKNFQKFIFFLFKGQMKTQLSSKQKWQKRLCLWT